VDDEVETADLFTEMLRDDYAVRTAYSGEEALGMMNSDVSVVLLDRRMPGMSGDEVLQTIRARDFDCRVVMVTALEPDIGILELPFDEYLVKTVMRDEIRDAVSRMEGRQRAN
jgi:CheY-like chemotaxis protein